MTERGGARLHQGLLALAAIVLVGHSLVYNFVTDDAYISFVFSRNLAEHGQLAFNLGQPVEGYTNFLWTVILAGGMVLGIPPEISSRVLGTACALVTLFVTVRTMERALGRKTAWAVVPAFLLASSSGFACWTSGGLETQLFTMLVVIAIDGVVDAMQRPGAIRRAAVALALSAMTRPEGLLVAGVLGVVHLTTLVSTFRTYRKLPHYRYELVAVLAFLVVWGPWFAWRSWYYGHLWPNTYYVKASGAWTNKALPFEMMKGGAYYLWVWLSQTRLLYALPLAIFGLIVGAPRTPRFVLAMICTLLAATYLPYAVVVGGDFMGLHRFIMPMFVIAAVSVTLGLEWLVAQPAGTRRRLSAALIVVIAGGVGWLFTREPWWTPWVADHGAGTLALVSFLGILGATPDRWRGICGSFLAAMLIAGFAVTQVRLTRESLRPDHLIADHGVIDTPAFLIVYTEDRAKIGRVMAPCFRADDFSIVGGAGAQPYFGRMRGVDVFGLVSERIAHEEPRIRARAGHTKFASDPLLAQYDPTFVFSCYQIHAKPDPQPHLGCGGYWLPRGYEEVTMHIPGMQQQGEYYTFLAKKARNFQCLGRVH